jgi:ADP-ribosyl-[dinitrogen reductase] hydrolase
VNHSSIFTFLLAIAFAIASAIAFAIASAIASRLALCRSLVHVSILAGRHITTATHLPRTTTTTRSAIPSTDRGQHNYNSSSMFGRMMRSDSRRATHEEFELLNRFPDGLEAAVRDELGGASMNRCSILSADDPDRAVVQQLLHCLAASDAPAASTVTTTAVEADSTDSTSEQGAAANSDLLDLATSRALASLMGNVVGDSLGSPLEFSPVRYGSHELVDLIQPEVWQRAGYNSFGLKPGQWTDDASMALCLADSLIVHERLEPLDLRLRFLNWWAFGYNNAFGNDEQRYGGSVGLGGNISQSMNEFRRNRSPFTTAGDHLTSGNGSLMRNGPIGVFYAHDAAGGKTAAWQQSKTTHQGHEAAAACQLLTHVVTSAIAHPAADPDVVRRDVLGRDGSLASFSCDVPSVMCVARSEQELRCDDNRSSDLRDRDWRWRAEHYQYSPTRSAQQPGYIGSYAMDNIAMSLHCVWTTDSFTAAVLKAANLRGDSDSVCAVVGQIAGAIYGLRAIPLHWIHEVQKWDNGDTLVKAWKLYTKGPRASKQG